MCIYDTMIFLWISKIYTNMKNVFERGYDHLCKCKKWTFYVRILYDYALLMYGKLYVMGFLKDRKSL